MPALLRDVPSGAPVELTILDEPVPLLDAGGHGPALAQDPGQPADGIG